jgi:hypothetical protein
MKNPFKKKVVLLYLEHLWYAMLLAGFICYLSGKHIEQMPVPELGFFIIYTLIWSAIMTDGKIKSERNNKLD